MSRRVRIACGAGLLLWLATGGILVPSALAAGPPDHAVGPPRFDDSCNGCARALVTFTGRVTVVAVTGGAGEPPWIEAVLEIDGAAQSVRVRIAPQPVLEGAGFRVAVGHRLQVRAFAGGTTHDVQRLRDRETGRVLRLRTLRGEPLWSAGGGFHHGGYGPGPHHGQHGSDRGHGPGGGP